VGLAEVAGAPKYHHGFAVITLSLSQWAPSLGGYVSTLMRIPSAFAQAGIYFLDNDIDGGIRMRLKMKAPETGM